MSRNPRIQPLNETLMMVQLNSYMDRFDNEIAKMNKKTKKWLLIGGIPFLVTVGVGAFIESFFPLLIGLIYFSGVAMVKTVKDAKEEEMVIMKKYGTNPEPVPDDVPDFTFIEDPIVSKTEKDYHSDYYKERLRTEARKAKLTLYDSSGKILYTDEEEKEPYVEIPGYLNKEETMVQVSDEYRVYKKVYNLPELSITNREWEILFDTVYHKLEESCSEEEFYDYMSFLLRYVIAFSLVNNRSEMSFRTFINQVSRFELVGMKKEDVCDLKKKLETYIKPTKVLKVDFTKIIKKTK